ncbi:Uncharacterised protein [Mycobacteroides abscessus subsp. abscessus]|nr:Uncharacterised protein [Mycobacteroides abscessus subsp. abscessus]
MGNMLLSQKVAVKNDSFSSHLSCPQDVPDQIAFLQLQLFFDKTPGFSKAQSVKNSLGRFAHLACQLLEADQPGYWEVEFRSIEDHGSFSPDFLNIAILSKEIQSFANGFP